LRKQEVETLLRPPTLPPTLKLRTDKESFGWTAEGRGPPSLKATDGRGN